MEHDTMPATELRREIKKIVDQLPPDQLASSADYVHVWVDLPCRAAHSP
jgi:hypothetical protein